ncbi:MAG: hypothetical protein ABGY42_16225, partial [bacterium]
MIRTGAVVALSLGLVVPAKAWADKAPAGPVAADEVVQVQTAGDVEDVIVEGVAFWLEPHHPVPIRAEQGLGTLSREYAVCGQVADHEPFRRLIEEKGVFGM